MDVDELPCYGEEFQAPSVGSLLVSHKPGDAREFIPELFNKRRASWGVAGFCFCIWSPIYLVSFGNVKADICRCCCLDKAGF